MEGVTVGKFRNSLHFMETEGFLQRLQQLATCSYLEPDQSIPSPHPILEDPF
jgi:hypothetical protein